jgi:hypothetical protein
VASAFVDAGGLDWTGVDIGSMGSGASDKSAVVTIQMSGYDTLVERVFRRLTIFSGFPLRSYQEIFGLLQVPSQYPPCRSRCLFRTVCAIQAGSN